MLSVYMVWLSCLLNIYERSNKEEGIEKGKIEGRREGKHEGRREEMAHGICVLVETCHELGVPVTDTISRVAANFGLPADEAELEVKKYWEAGAVIHQA